MGIKINNLIKLVDNFAKFSDSSKGLKPTIENAAVQGIISNFIGDLISDDVNANIKIGYPSGWKSLLYSELEVSPLQFERGLSKEQLSYLQNKYARVPAQLKAYLSKHKLVPEGGPFIITFP